MPDTPPARRYAFGDFVLEAAQQRVSRRDGTALNLTPRLFAALLLFVERKGELLDKDTLMLALWPGLVVEENNLSQVVSGLRRALGDDAQGSRYIQTVPRRGFRFVAEVSVLGDAGAAPSEPVSHAPADLEPQGARPAIAAGSRRTALVLTSAVVGAGLAGGIWWLARTPSRPGTAAKRATLAVLPFKPLVSEARDELLEVGMADSLIARLSTVPGLVVRSIGSVRRYVGPDQDPIRAARELEVAWILDGSLQRRGDDVRVTARLLSADDGTAAWSGSFDEKFTGVFDLQDAISERVVRVLGLWLDNGASPAAWSKAVGGTRNFDAYQLYLAARQHAQGIRASGLKSSVDLYNKALAIDPRYALAYAGLVETHRRRLFGADVTPAEAFEPALVAARRALELAPELAEAHAGMAWIRFWFDFEWLDAERLFRAALALNANAVEAHFGLGLLLLSLDRPDEGFAHIRNARQLDPMSLILNTLEASFLLARGQRDEAAARLQRAFDIEPDFWVAHLTLGVLHSADGKLGDAIQAFRRADALADGSSQASSLLAVHLARSGKRDEAREILQRLLALQRTRYVPPTSIAAVHAALGEPGPALDALDRAYAARDTRLVYMKDDARWTDLRGEPRFASLLKRMNLDRYGPGRAAN